MNQIRFENTVTAAIRARVSEAQAADPFHGLAHCTCDNSDGDLDCDNDPLTGMSCITCHGCDTSMYGRDRVRLARMWNRAMGADK